MSGARHLAFRLQPGADLRASLEAFTREQALSAAYVATCVGSLRSASIRFAGQENAASIEGPFEIVSLVGTLSPDGAHLHIAISDGAGKTVAGHLGMGSPIHTTAEVVLVELQELAFSRRPDAATGYPELVIEKRC